MNIKLNILKFVKSFRSLLNDPLKFFRYYTIKPNHVYHFGSPEWFVAAEKKYGGYHTFLKRRLVSPSDHRNENEINKGGMQGGDRMYHHSYSKIYSQYLKPFSLDDTNPKTLIEIGILKGTGLAIWSEFMPKADIIGLDIDLSYTTENIPFLMSKGAFKKKPPELHKFDQLNCDPHDVKKILGSRKIDICIDDGLHSDESIIKTLNAVIPSLADNFVYFIEDHATISSVLSVNYPQFKIIDYDEMTVIVPKNFKHDISL